MWDEATASITAATLYSEAGCNDATPTFLSPDSATYRQTILHQHHHNQLFSRHNLVSDDQGHLNAQLQDPNLINPWGVAFSPTSPFWVNNNAAGTSKHYLTNATTKLGIVVTIAPPVGPQLTPFGRRGCGGYRRRQAAQ